MVGLLSGVYLTSDRRILDSPYKIWRQNQIVLQHNDLVSGREVLEGVENGEFDVFVDPDVATARGRIIMEYCRQAYQPCKVQRLLLVSVHRQEDRGHASTSLGPQLTELSKNKMEKKLQVHIRAFVCIYLFAWFYLYTVVLVEHRI